VNPTLQGYAAAVMEAADPASLHGIADDLAAIERQAVSNASLRAALTDTSVPGRVRRAAPAPDEPVVCTPDFTVDLAAKQVIRSNGEDVRLTPTEWQLLEILARNSGRLVTQRQLLREVWGPTYETETNYLRVYLAQLRRKLEPEPSRPRYLLTESGMGYRFKP